MPVPSPDQNPRKESAGAVLLVDDEEPLLALYAEALSPHFEVSTAGSAREAGFLMHKKAFKVLVLSLIHI